MNWRVLVASLLCMLACTACVAPNESTPGTASASVSPPPAPRERALKRLALATAYYEQGRNDVALQETRSALKIDPTSAQAQSLLGLIYQRDNLADLAEKSFSQALALAQAEPADIAAVAHNYGWFLCLQNRFSEGQTQLKRALSQPGEAGFAKTWAVLGLCQQRAQQLPQAAQSYQQALQLEPGNVWVRVRLAELTWRSGQPDQARQWLLPALEGPDATADSLWLGIRLAQVQTQSATMQQLAQQLTRRFPDSPQAKAWREQQFDQP